jgi:hypothetical protein
VISRVIDRNKLNSIKRAARRDDCSVAGAIYLGSLVGGGDGGQSPRGLLSRMGDYEESLVA